jgi:hypothetical protein
MLKVTGTIEGVAPVLFSKMQLDELSGSTGKKSEEYYLAEAMRRYHKDDRGAYIPAQSFKRAMIEGAAKAGIKDPEKKRAGFASMLEAIVFVEGHIYLGKDKPDEILKTWGRRPPGPKGAAVTLYYPQFNDWRATFSLTVTVGGQQTMDAVRRSIDAAGLLVGLGSWRPEYGRFLLTEWAAQ